MTRRIARAGRALVLCLCGLAGCRTETPPQAPPGPRLPAFAALGVRPFQQQGAPGEKVDVVVVGDGYTRSQLLPGGKFEQDVRAFLTYFFREPPFRAYADCFNVYAVYVESPDPGAEDRPGEDRKRNAFDSSFGVGGIDRLLQYQDSGAVLRAARTAPAMDIVFVMVNDDRYGGSGGAIQDPDSGRSIPAPCFSSRGLPSYQVALHELGHSFANLGDEYVDAAAAPKYRLPSWGRDLDSPNLTLARSVKRKEPEFLRAHLKWGHFLDLDGAEGQVGLFEGGYFREQGVFRACKRCKMRDYEDPFCPVCQEAIVRRIFEIIGRPFDDAAYHRKNPIRR